MSVFSLPLVGTKGYGKLTQSAGTVITRLIEPRAGAFTHLSRLVYTAGTTAHTLTVMRCLNRTTLSADAAGSQAVINLTADPGAYSTTGAKNGNTVRTANNVIAGGDYLVYQAADGSFIMDVVSSVATLAITMTTSLPTGGAKSGAPVWFFGVPGDTNPNDAQANPTWNLFASTTTVLGGLPGDGVAGFTGTFDGLLLGMTGVYEPLIIYSNNASNAGTLEC